jgi:hypothetical protein
MIYFFQRAGGTRSCQTRLEAHGPGLELVITEGRDSQVERFRDARELLSRQDELRRAWSLHGWRPVDFDDDDGDTDE